MFDVDAVGLLARELVRERVATLVAEAGLAVPVPPAQAASLLAALDREGLDAQEVLEVLPHLPRRGRHRRSGGRHPGAGTPSSRLLRPAGGLPHGRGG